MYIEGYKIITEKCPVLKFNQFNTSIEYIELDFYIKDDLIYYTNDKKFYENDVQKLD